MEKLNGPVYRSWDEAMADPDFDPSKPWHVAPDPEPAKPTRAATDWTGWGKVGMTDAR